jgi:hypothetical protein
VLKKHPFRERIYLTMLCITHLRCYMKSFIYSDGWIRHAMTWACGLLDNLPFTPPCP